MKKALKRQYSKLQGILIDAYDCSSTALQQPLILSDVLNKAAKKMGARVVHKSQYSYCAHGITIVLFLAESHILISTWPESKYAFIEVFCCLEQADVDKGWKQIQKILKPQRIKVKKSKHSTSLVKI